MDIGDLAHKARDHDVSAELHHHLLEQREQERLQIARDLHDGPVQDLVATALFVRGLRLDCGDPKLSAGLDILSKLLQEQIEQLRNYAGELRPPTLWKFGFEEAIRSHLDNFREKHPDVGISLEVMQEGEQLPENTRLALFRILQQALNNILGHAAATQVWIRLRKDPLQVVFEIQDNGAGFEVPSDWLEFARQGHFGLVGMRERAEAIGGQLEVISKPGQGTTVRVIVPLE